MQAKAKKQPKAKAKARSKALRIDKYAQLPRSLQSAAKMLDERDLTLRVQEALNNRRHRDERTEHVPEHRGRPMDMRTLERTVDRVASSLGSAVRAPSRSPAVSKASSMSIDPGHRLRAAFAAMRGRPAPDDDEF